MKTTTSAAPAATQDAITAPPPPNFLADQRAREADRAIAAMNESLGFTAQVLTGQIAGLASILREAQATLDAASYAVIDAGMRTRLHSARNEVSFAAGLIDCAHKSVDDLKDVVDDGIEALRAKLA